MVVPLVDLLDDPMRVRDLQQEEVPALITRCAALQTALAARMMEADPVEETTTTPERWLTPEEADGISHLGVRWLYRHWESVPGAKKFSAKRLRFQERHFRRWLEKRS